MDSLWLLVVLVLVAVVVALVAIQRRRRAGSVLSVDSVRRSGSRR